MTITFRLLAATLLTALYLSPVGADRRAPRTVLDYYLMTPDRYMELDWFYDDGRLVFDRKTELFKSRKSGGVIDLSNDYIFQPIDSGPDKTFALFRHGGDVLAAVSYEKYDMWPDREFALHLLRYDKGRWRDVTKQLLPAPHNKNYYYMLPRYGTTIQVIACTEDRNDLKGRIVDRLEWRGGRFVSVLKHRHTKTGGSGSVSPKTGVRGVSGDNKPPKI